MGLADTCTLPDGRRLGYDDVGDATGIPVLYVHGTPDSRRARHPADAVAARLGIRLVALDRPGHGLSDPHPTRTLGSFADDATALADHLGVATWRPFAWSGGATYALALAARRPDRVERVAVAAGLVPFEAYDEPHILDDADGGRHLVAEVGAELGAVALAEMAAPMLVPYPCDEALAREHVLEVADGERRAVLAAQPELLAVLAAGAVDSVAQGPAGITREVELQVEPPDVDWSAVAAPVDLWYGATDHTAPVAFGRWWEQRLRGATLEVVPDAGHLVALTHWTRILERLTARGEAH